MKLVSIGVEAGDHGPEVQAAGADRRSAVRLEITGGKPTRARPYVLMVTNMWPHEVNPVYGIFVERQVESVRALGLECDVLFVEGYRDRGDYGRLALHMLRLNWSRCQPVLVHAHGGETAPAVRWFIKAPVVVSYCGDDLLGTPGASGGVGLGSRLRRLFLRQHARLMTATITKSREMATVLPRPAQSRNLVLPNGVDRTLFRPRPRDEARRELGWALEERIVLFAADPAVERKRYWLAEAACGRARLSVGDIRLHVANITPPTVMPLLMAAADCLLLTSAIEGSPNVIKEAVTCGLPVVSTDVGDVREILQDVEPAWICPADAGQLSTALIECLIAGRRSNGWERSGWFGEEQIARRLLDFYGSLTPKLVADEVSV